MTEAAAEVERERLALRRLELTVTRRLDGLLQGDYRGLVPGHGSELGDTRLYAAGDDVRRIDWNVTARTNEPHVRDNIADRELETWLVVDLSPSIDFGTTQRDKHDLALVSAAAVGFLTARIGNRVGAIILDASGAHVVPARQGRQHLRAILSRIQKAPRVDARPEVDLAGGLRRLLTTATRRGLVVAVSDFLPNGDWEEALRQLSTRHETLAVELVDPRELELPDVGLLTVVDPESGRLLEVNTRKRGTRERFAAAALAEREAIARAIRGAGADHLRLQTDDDWLLAIARFVTLRRKRIESLPRSTR